MRLLVVITSGFGHIRPSAPIAAAARRRYRLGNGGAVKRVAFGFRRFVNYRIRALLYAGRPNWDLLATIAPRSLKREAPAKGSWFE